MGNFIWRSFIVMAIFIAGVLVGDIFAPKQILEQKDITSVEQVQTSIDLDIEDNLETLSQNQNIDELYLAVVRQTYQRAKREYEYQLENLNKNEQSKKDFIKAQKNYLAIINFIEQKYPLIQENAEQENSSAEAALQETATPQAALQPENAETAPQEKSSQEKQEPEK